MIYSTVQGIYKMFVDLLGKTRIKLALHTQAPGGETLEELAEAYFDHGFDAISITENWKYNGEGELKGVKIISGCEYSMGGLGEGEEAYHIVGVGMTSDPEVPSAWKNMIKTARAKAADTIKMIKRHNGFAFVAYPVHNRNNAESILDFAELEGIEIFNSEVEYGVSKNGYAGEIVDRMSTFGISPVLIASNGVNCYEDEEYLASIMVEATDMDTSHILRALRQGRFYSTEGPEIHIERIGADKVKVVCSPALKIEFFSDCGKTSAKLIEGEGLIQAEYCIKDGERFVRAEVTDGNGRMAWSNNVRFDDIYR